MFKQSTKRNIIVIICAIVALAAFIGVAVFAGMYYPARKKASDNYLKELQQLSFYGNTIEEAIPQTVVYDLIASHFNSNNGKTPKVLFIGYDGCQAIMPKLNFGSDDSAVTKVAATGGMYLAYCGGINKGDQDTSTAPGWAAEFTGVWATENGVFSNINALNRKTPSIMMHLASKGKSSSFSVSWEPHIGRTYRREVAKAIDKEYPLTYLLNSSDEGTYQSMRGRIMAGDDAVFGILEYNDRLGHRTGFSIDNPEFVQAYYDSETKAMQLINAVESRDTYQQEDWLIIITTDHGGYLTGHGGTTPMESLIFLATNKPLT